MLGLAHLPEDILLRIVFFLSPSNIIRLRKVSKTMYSVTCQFLVWVHAYRSAALPRPPGPYARSGDKDALDFLQRTLVSSEYLEPWSHRRFRIPACHMFPNPARGQTHILWGSWLIAAIDSSITYRNIDSDNMETHVLFQLKEPNAYLELIQCVDTVDLVGQPITYALIRDDDAPVPLTLLTIVGHFRASLSLKSAISLSFPGHDRISDITAGPLARYICMTGLSEGMNLMFALLDTITGKTYQLPSFSSGVEPQELSRFTRGGYDWSTLKYILTDTHILLTFSDYDITFQESLDFLIQAFALPHESDVNATANDGGMLRMTHEGICRIYESPKWTLRSNTVTDVADRKSTEIRLMGYYSTDYATTYYAIDLTLSQGPSPLGTIKRTQFTSLFSFAGETIFADLSISQDGFGRGVCCFRDSDYIGTCIRTFSVDASGAICGVKLGPRVEVAKMGAGNWGSVTTLFHAWNGKLYFDSVEGEQVIKVFEFE